LYEPPSDEIESLLFALQAALGAGFIGYYIGYKRGKTKRVEV
jgi:cobalt/nickel transport protein